FYNAGLRAIDLRDWAGAQTKLELAHSYAPTSTEINLALGNLWLEQREFSRAERYYSDILRVDSGHKAALRNLGVAALFEKHWDSAANYFHAALQVDPADATTRYLYARAQYEEGCLDEALSEI